MKRSEETKVADGLTLEEAMRLQEIESNPLSPDDIAMFRMFERESWPQERRIAHILTLAKTSSMVPAAE